ncbi:MAG: RNA 2'-phosphotransferase [Deltaproteobacteria bacterium]|nr:MAG: RNA 2'-phosphotransferase [Deltaproteobacteria bacterium]
MSHRHKVIALSKLIAYILRHRPDEFGLVLDEEGFVSVKELQQAIAEEEGWSYVRRSHIMEVVYTSDRERFELHGDKIRATYGHSLPQKISYEPTQPPKILYHGTRRRAYLHILQRGLDPMGRQYVHLTTSPELATRIGRRRDPQPVLLEIQALRAYNEGIVFYQANPLIYLADHIPAAYINGPAVSKVLLEKRRAVKVKGETSPMERELPGSVVLDLKMEPLHRKEKSKGWRENSRRYRRRRRYL